MVFSRMLIVAAGFAALGVTAAAADGIRSDNGPLTASIYETIRQQQGTAQPGPAARPDASVATGSLTREAQRGRDRARSVR